MRVAPLIGFMQGRLSPGVGGRIQAFPWMHWREEFALAEQHGFPLIEWVLEADRLDENPLMTAEGRREICALRCAHGVRVDTVTADTFKTAPFFKVAGRERNRRLDELTQVLVAASEAGVRQVMLPLVDEARVDGRDEEAVLRDGLTRVGRVAADGAVQITFESDYPGPEFARFMASLDPQTFGVTFDIGDRASKGYAPADDVRCFGARIANVHVKDRRLGGTTVPLGEGDADLPRAFAALQASGYAGHYVLQAARAIDGDHAGVLTRYRAHVRANLGLAESDEARP